MATFLLAALLLNSTQGGELSNIMGTHTHIHAEWTKHRTWVRGTTPVEDDLNNTFDIAIRPDQSFAGTFDQSAKSWSQSLGVDGSFRTRTFSAGQGFFHIQGSALLGSNSLIFVRQIGKAIEKFELDVAKRKGVYVCTIRDEFMKQKGAPVEFEFNGVVEHHDGPEPIVSSSCKIY